MKRDTEDIESELDMLLLNKIGQDQRKASGAIVLMIRL